MTTQKIVFIASYADSLINFRLHLIKEFLKKNYAVTALAPEDKSVAAKLTACGVKFVPIKLERNGLNVLKDILLLIKLIIILRQEKPDYLFTYTIKPVIYGSIAGKLVGIQNSYAMMTGTGYIFSKTNLKTRLIGYIAKKMCRFALQFNKKIFFQNKDNVTSFLTHKLIGQKQPIAIINGSGVDVDFFQPKPFPTVLTFLMIARLIYDKGVREYIEAARQMKLRYPHIQFQLVGWIDTNPHSITKDELSQWIKAGFINYLGKLSDVRSAIAASSVYVLPSYGEGTPRTVLEAMSMGRPIITTNVAGCRETVINGQNGFLAAVQNVEALCMAMEYFIHKPEAIAEMGTISRDIAIKKYDVNKVNAFILKEMHLQQNVFSESEKPFFADR